jgi:signal transduction histidine kinase
LFLIAFIQLRKEKGFLYKLLVALNIFMISYLLIDAYIIYGTHYINYSILSFALVRYVLLAVSIISVIVLFQQKRRLSNYIAYGIFFLFLFGLVSLLYTPLQLSGSTFHNFFDMRIPWYQLGIFIELILFSMGLQYKTNLRNRQNIMYAESLKIENEKKEFETFMVVMETKEKERSRIAQEIHDDIGSGLTSIRLLSEIAKEKNKNAPLGEIDKISASASELIENMNEIIWSINSKNDHLANLIAYIRRYVVTYFENFENIIVRTNTPTTIPDVQITGDFRRAVFLTIKEALHNVIKHADANLVNLDIQVELNKMNISLKDNGKGFSNDHIRPFSNGLKNMRERMENLGGNFLITSHEGTLVKIQLPI